MDGPDKKPLIHEQLEWISVYLEIVFVIMILLLFPLALASSHIPQVLVTLYAQEKSNL